VEQHPAKEPKPSSEHDLGADGLKTSHLDGGGFGLIGSAVQPAHRPILALNWT
jgi:hypothetical protein